MPDPAAVTAAREGMVTLLFLLQGVWGLFLLVLAWSLRRVLKDIEENTKETKKVSEAVNALNILLAGNYVGRGEMNQLYDRMREQEGKVIEMKARDDLVRELMKARERFGDRDHNPRG
jgi:hypothetical protein